MSVQHTRISGRGARSNASGRYESEKRIADDAPPAPLNTQIHIESARRIITRNRSPDIGFDRSINAYRGCEHGCVYCYARPSHAYMGLSPGLDFESRLFAKPNAPELLRRELAKPGYKKTLAPIAMGTNTDPYQPIERKMRITRQVLEVLAACAHPATITTKSTLILRDLDILTAMAKRNLIRVAVSITTLDGTLARRMEPRAATPQKRLETLRALAGAGIPSAVMFAPVIPALNDAEMERVLTAAAEAGARGAGFVLLRLPLEIKDLFHEWLDAHVPDKARHILSLLRQMRGGREYDSRWWLRHKGTGPYAAMLAQRYRMACARLELNKARVPLNTGDFIPPGIVPVGLSEALRSATLPFA